MLPYLPIINTALLLGISISSTYAVYLTVMTHEAAKETLNVSLLTEKNTNSMKDDLVAATDRAAHAIGKAEGIIEEKLSQKEEQKNV